MPRKTSLLLLLVSMLAIVPWAAAQDSGHKTGSKQSLKACLEAAGIYTVTGAHPDYEKARRTLSHFSSNYPVAVVEPTNTQQVQAAVGCAKAARVKVLPRCGAHGNEGESVQTGAITLDLQRMNRVQLAPDLNTAWVEGGAQVGKLLAVVMRDSNGTRGFPSGVRPSVGVGGFILGGGFGGYTRYAGLGADNLIAVKGVTADGDVITADKDNNLELLWASRGAGGGKFLVVTDFHVRLMDVTPGITNFYFTVPYDKAIDAMMFYQAWAPNLPAVITHRAGVKEDPGSGRISYYIGGRYMGPIKDAKAALIASGLHNSGMLHVDNFTFKFTDYAQAVEDGIGFSLPPGPDKFTIYSERKWWEFEYAWSYKYRSLILDRPMSREFFKTALEFAQFPGSEVEFQALTGAVSNVPKDATAVGHLRDGALVLIIRGTKESLTNKVTSAWGERLPPTVQACPVSDDVKVGSRNATEYIQKLGALVPEVKSYINFRDTDLPAWAPDFLTTYYGDQLQALECVKLKHDPTNTFSLPMDIRPSTSAASCPELLAKVGAAAASHSRYLLSSGPARSAPPSFAGAQAAPEKSRAAAAKQQAPPAAGRRLAHHLAHAA